MLRPTLSILLLVLSILSSSVLAFFSDADCTPVAVNDVNNWKANEHLDDGVNLFAPGTSDLGAGDIREDWHSKFVTDAFRVIPWKQNDFWRSTVSLGNAGKAYNMFQVTTYAESYAKAKYEWFWINKGQTCQLKDVAFRNIIDLRSRQFDTRIWQGRKRDVILRRDN